MYQQGAAIGKVLISFGLIIAAGFLWRYFDPGGIDRHRARHALSTAVFHFFIPPLAFGLMARTQVDWSFIAVPLTGTIVIFTSIGAGFAAYRMLPWFKAVDGPTFGVLILSGAFGNVMYLGLPVITETAGPHFGYIAVLYDLLASTPILLTIGVFIAARYGSGRAVSLGSSLRRVLRLPPLWGVAAGLAVRLLDVPVPQLVLDTAGLMGRAVVPIMIFTVGLALDFHDMKRLPVAVPALVIKLAFAPVLAARTGAALGLSGWTLNSTIIEGAMPVMVLSLVIADEFDLDVPLAAMCITVSTVLLFFTMPFVARLFT